MDTDAFKKDNIIIMQYLNAVLNVFKKKQKKEVMLRQKSLPQQRVPPLLHPMANRTVYVQAIGKLQKEIIRKISKEKTDKHSKCSDIWSQFISMMFRQKYSNSFRAIMTL